MSAALVSLLFATVGAIELTTETWDAATSGKTMFVKFHAPWCGHCKKMKLDWAQADVRSLCQLSVPCSPSPPMSNGDRGLPGRISIHLHARELEGGATHKKFSGWRFEPKLCLKSKDVASSTNANYELNVQENKAASTVQNFEQLRQQYMELSNRHYDCKASRTQAAPSRCTTTRS